MSMIEGATPMAVEIPAEQFRRAMRELTGAVSVVTVGEAEHRTGFAATSVTSFSADPPRLILCINRNSSSWPVLLAAGRFGINFVSETDAAIANRFAGFGGVKGCDRYEGAEWVKLASGTQVLKDALAGIDCTVEEILERHDHSIVLAKIESIRICDKGKPLLWFQSGYYRLGDPLTNK